LLHGHALLYNIGPIPLDKLKEEWRFVTGIDDAAEPRIEKYDPAKGDGIGYVVKTLGTDADLIVFSPKFGRKRGPKAKN
jgi:hypothetical protein